MPSYCPAYHARGLGALDRGIVGFLQRMRVLEVFAAGVLA